MEDIGYPKQFLGYWTVGRKKKTWTTIKEATRREAETGYLLVWLRDQ
jgi:hypothetical protein